MGFETTVEINADPARVWEVMTDVERWPEWTDSAESVQKIEGGPLAEGIRVKIKQPRLPETTWRVTDVQPGRSFAWESKRMGMTTVATHAIVPGERGCTVFLTLEMTGLIAPVVARMYRGMVTRYMAMEAQGLKARSESPPAA